MASKYPKEERPPDCDKPSYSRYIKCKCRCKLCHNKAKEYRKKFTKTEAGIFNSRKQNNVLTAKRKAAIAKIKIEAGCKDCGYDKHYAALDFDHIGKKNFDVSQNIRLAWSRVLAEIALCEVVCSNCHRIRTFNRYKKINDAKKTGTKIPKGPLTRLRVSPH